MKSIARARCPRCALTYDIAWGHNDCAGQSSAALLLDVEYGHHDGVGVAALIIEVPSGVRWTNQTGGIACHHPDVEGVMIPVTMNEESHRALSDFGESELGMGFTQVEHVSAETFDWLDAWLLARTAVEPDWRGRVWGRVDRARATVMEEAWVPLRDVFLPDGDALTAGAIVGPFRAILTWDNSD